MGSGSSIATGGIPETDNSVQSEAEKASKKLTVEKLPSFAESFQQQFKRDKKNGHYENDSNKFPKMLQSYYTRYVHKHRVKMGDALSQLDSAVGTIVDYVILLTSNGSKFPEKGEDRVDDSLFLTLMNVLVKFTDASTLLAEELGKRQLVTILLKLLQLIAVEQTTKETITPIQHEINIMMLLLLNCSKPPNNGKYYRAGKGMSTIAWIVQNGKELGIKITTIASGMLILANTIDEKNNEIIMADNSIIKWLQKTLKGALARKRHRSAQGFSAEELVEGISKLASNNQNSDAIVESGILDSLLVMMETGTENEKTTATNAVWALSFTSNNQEKFKSNEKLQELLAEFAKAEEKSKLKESANGVLWVLHSNDTTTTEQDINEAHVMLSYSWDNQHIILRIKEKLESHGYNVWMDVDRMGGSTLQAMADAVEESAVVLICMSQKYKDSPNCRTEGEYAYKLQKEIIPLQIESGYSPDGWLGAILGAKLYFDFSKHEQFDTSFTKLLKELGDKGKLLLQGQGMQHMRFDDERLYAGAADASDQTTAKLWSCDDVCDWANAYGIKSSKLRNIDGRTLIFLKNMRLEAPEYFYHYIEKHIQITKPMELMLFVEALNTVS